MDHSAFTEARQHIEAAYSDRGLLEQTATKDAVKSVIDAIDEAYCASATKWIAIGLRMHVQTSYLLYFVVAEMEVMEMGPFEFFDKIPLKKNLKEQGVGVVPPGTVRYGSHVERGAVVMPGYVNIGAFVGGGTMVDTGRP